MGGNILDSTYTLALRFRIRSSMDIVYGSGIARLLQKTEELGSLTAATKALHMPYRRALDIISNAEHALGRSLLIRTSGGPHGGGSTVTPYGKKLFAVYTQFEEKVRAYAETEFSSVLAVLNEPIS